MSFPVQNNGEESATREPASWDPSQYIDESGLTPVTLLQISQCEQVHPTAPFTMFGREIKFVKIVAHLLHAEMRPASLIIVNKLDDGTGWVSAHERRTPKENSTYDDGHQLLSDPDFIGNDGKQSYVRVVGRLSRFNNRNYLKISAIREVVDYHEVMHHSLECMEMSIINDRGVPPRIIQPRGTSSGNLQTPSSLTAHESDSESDDSVQIIPRPSPERTPQRRQQQRRVKPLRTVDTSQSLPSPVRNFGNRLSIRSPQRSNSHLLPPDFPHLVLQCIAQIDLERTSESDKRKGVPLHDLEYEILAQYHCSREQFWDALQYLKNEFYIYFPIDEQHVKVTRV